MLPLVKDFHENSSACIADHSEPNDPNLRKIGSIVPKAKEFENWLFL